MSPASGHPPVRLGRTQPGLFAGEEMAIDPTFAGAHRIALDATSGRTGAGLGARRGLSAPMRSTVSRLRPAKHVRIDRTLAMLRSFLGARLGANGARRQATLGHVQPQSPQVNSTQGDVRPHRATV